MKRIIAVAEFFPNSCQVLFVDLNKLDLEDAKQKNYFDIVENALENEENEGEISKEESFTFGKEESFTFGGVWLEDALIQPPCKVIGVCILKGIA